jgi:O-antigen/teichoic acid export membrane protein
MKSADACAARSVPQPETRQVKNRYSKEGARRSLVYTVTFRVLSQLSTILSYVVIVRGMTEHDFGVFNLLYGFIPVVGTVVSLGIEQTLRRYQPEYLRTGQDGHAAWLVRVVASIRFATTVLVVLLLIGIWNWVAPIFQLGPYRFQFILFSALIMLAFQSRILQLSLASHMMHGYSVGSLAVIPFVKLLAYLGLWLTERFTLEAAIFADTAAYGVGYILLRIVHYMRCRPPPGVKVSAPVKEERKRMVKYGLYNNFNDVGSVLLGVRSDNFFIAALLNAVAVGGYAFYTRLNEMVNNASPSRLFDNVIEPVFFATPPEHAGVRIPRYFTLLLNLNLPLQWAAFAYAAAYHHEIVATLFAGKFIEWSPLLPLVIAFGLLGVIATPVTLVAQYAEKAAVILFSKVAVIYQVIATLTLIPVIGIYGAAIATGTGTLLKNLIIWWHVRSSARWLNFRAVLLMSTLIWGPAIGLCILAKEFVPAPMLVHMAFGLIVMSIAGTLYLRSPAIAESDREILGTLLKGRESRVLQLIGLLRPGAKAA